LDEAVDIGRFPFEIAFWVIGGSDVGVEEELAGVGERPVFWDYEFGFAGFGGCDEGFEVAVFSD